MVERFFRDITMHLCDGSFSSVRELGASIQRFSRSETHNLFSMYGA